MRFISTLQNKLLKRGSQVQFWWRAKIQKRHNQLCLERVNDLDLLVLPDVFNPTLFGTSVFLANYLRRHREWFSNAPNVLDLGCGSGILGLTAARLGARVMATDLNPEAVRCSGLNARLNQVEAVFEVRQGVLYEPVSAEKFDFILCNPPFFAKEPKTELERAFFAGTNQIVLRAILFGLAAHLSPNGRAFLVVSDQIGFEQLLSNLDLGGLRWQIANRKRWWGEQQLIYDLRF